MGENDLSGVETSRRAFVTRLIAAGLSAPKIVSFVLGSPSLGATGVPAVDSDPCLGDLSGNPGSGGSGNWNYSGTITTLSGGVNQFSDASGNITFCDPSGNLLVPSGNVSDQSGNSFNSSGNIINSSGNLLIDGSANFGSPGGYTPTMLGTITSYFPFTTVPASVPKVVTLPPKAGTQIVLKNEPAKSLALDAAVAVNRSTITVGLLAPVVSKATKDPLAKYTFTLTPATKGARTISRTVSVKSGKVNSVALPGTAKATYRLKVTATLKSGKKTTWNGPSVTTK